MSKVRKSGAPGDPAGYPASFAEAQTPLHGVPVEAPGATGVALAEPAGKWTIGTAGRLVIPADVRAKLGVKEGDMLVATVVQGELRLMPVAAAVKRAQALVAHLKPTDGARVSDALIADRRREAERDGAKQDSAKQDSAKKDGAKRDGA